MPELPEVETMCERMDRFRGRKITASNVLRSNGKYDTHGVVGNCIIQVLRRGKKMIFTLTGDKCLVVHNAMSGFWDSRNEPWTFDYVEGSRKATDKDVRIEFFLDGGDSLRFHDSRLFGSSRVVTWSEIEKECSEMGPEAIRTPRMFPLAPVLNVLDMTIICDSKKPIKEVLMDQSRLAGVGNIYAAESLWMAQIHPLKPAKELGTQELTDLSDAIQGVLKSALANNLDYGVLNVYRQSECDTCFSKIEKVEVAKRTTYFCPKCQEMR